MAQNEILPIRIENAIQIINSQWSDEEREAFSNLDQHELNSLTPTLGLDIRNNFRLWSGNPALIEACQKEINNHPFLKEVLWKLFYLPSWLEGLYDDQEVQTLSKIDENTAFFIVFSEMNAYLASELIMYLTWLSNQKKSE